MLLTLLRRTALGFLIPLILVVICFVLATKLDIFEGLHKFFWVFWVLIILILVLWVVVVGGGGPGGLGSLRKQPRCPAEMSSYMRPSRYFRSSASAKSCEALATSRHVSS